MGVKTMLRDENNKLRLLVLNPGNYKFKKQCAVCDHIGVPRECYVCLTKFLETMGKEE